MSDICSVLEQAKKDRVFGKLYPTQRLKGDDMDYYVFGSSSGHDGVVVLSMDACDSAGLTKKFDLPLLELQEREISIFSDGTFCYKDMADNYSEVANALKYDDDYDMPDFYRVGVMHNEYIRSGYYVFNYTSRLEADCIDNLKELLYGSGNVIRRKRKGC